MEPYSMPQLDKPSPVYSDSQYEGDDPANRRQAPTNAKKQFAGVSNEPLPLLTSSAWSAVVHHPADEDSEPDDLPSTVDMDAIKGSLATPLSAVPKPTSSDCCDRNKRRGDDDGSDSEGTDDDSDSSDDSDSGSDTGSESGSCTWSDSDSGSTSCTSRSCSSQSSRVHQTFSIRETNIDQGGLKLKISALKIPKKIVTKEVSRSVEGEAKRTDTPVDKPCKDKAKVDKAIVSDRSQSPQVGQKLQKLPTNPGSKSDKCVADTKQKCEKIPNPVPSAPKSEKSQNQLPVVSKVDKSHVPKVSKSVSLNNSTSKADKTAVPSPVSAVKSVQATSPAKPTKGLPSTKVERSSPQAAVRTDKAGTGSKGRGEKSPVASAKVAPGNRAGTRSDSRKTDARRRDANARHKTKVSSATAARGSMGRAVARGTTKTTSSSRSSSDSEEEEGEGMSHIAQMVHAEQDSIAVSEHLQVINQEDLAAILPDVITPGQQDDEVGTPFDGFEDVSSESGKAANRGAESSSDVELPEQVVSAAIERIHLHGGRDSSSADASCDEETAPAVGHPYSSSLLQQFVEKTKLLSSQASEKASEIPKRRKRGRPPKLSKSKRAPEIEAYMQLDLSVSNVSPDSGIQSVAGSPSRRSVSPLPHPTAHSPASCESFSPASRVADDKTHKPRVKVEVRRGPGRPKGSVKKGKMMNSDFASGTDSCDEIPPAPSLGTVVKRGPGRPKKKPPAVGDVTMKCDKDPTKETEPFPLSKKDIITSFDKLIKSEDKQQKRSCDSFKSAEKSSPKVNEVAKQAKGSAILSEICERVSKRLDLPMHAVTSYPLKLAKVTLSKEFPRREGKTSRRGRKKREGERRRRVSSSSPGSGSNRGGNEARNHEDDKARQQPPAAMPQVPPPKVLSLPHGVPHKHKKRKKKAKQMKTIRLPDDPALLTDLERLVHLFSRSCTIAVSKSTTSGGVGVLPSLFRIKRNGKKRRGGDKSRANPPGDKSRGSLPGEKSRGAVPGEKVRGNQPGEKSRGNLPGEKSRGNPPGDKVRNCQPGDKVRNNSQPGERSRNNSQPGERSRNNSQVSDRESGTEGDAKEKSRQRRPKKSSVEPPKGHHERPEPANNEQRLPLKKRHYHMTQPQPSSGPQDVQSSTACKITPADGTRKSISAERAADKNTDKTAAKSDKASTNVANKSSPVEVKAKPISETRSSRNSLNSDRVTEKGVDKCVIKTEKNVGSGKSVPVEAKCKPAVDVPRKITSTAEVTTTRKSTSERNVDKSGDKAVVVKVEKGVEGKMKPVAEVARNSIDDAIEACISRYSTVVTTPKKRHRLLNPPSPRSVSTSNGKVKDVDVGANVNNAVLPGKRPTSRSASVTAANSPPTAIVADTKPVEGIFEPSKTVDLDLPIPPFLTSPVSKTATSSKTTSPNVRTCNTNTSPGNTCSSSPLSASNDVSPTPVSNTSKVNSPSSKSIVNSLAEKSVCKPLTVSVEPHSLENAVTSQNSNIISPKPKASSGKAMKASPKAVSPLIKPPVNKSLSPKSVDVLTEITSDVTPFHNLRLKRPAAVTPDEPDVKVVSKKKKLAGPNTDVRIQVTQVDPAEIVASDAVDVKKKVRRRKAINRTGFPVKKKKKKKKASVPDDSVAPFEGEDCEALIPKSIISVISNKCETRRSTSETLNRNSDTVQPKLVTAKAGKSASEAETKPLRSRDKSSQLDRTISRVAENKDDSVDSDCSRSGLEVDASLLEPEVLLYERTRKRRRENGDTLTNPAVKRFRKCNREEDTDSDAVLPDDVASCDESTREGGGAGGLARKKQPRWRKKYLVAGLFSDYYKEAEPRRVGDNKQPRSQVYKPEEHKYGLLPPPYHCGRYIRQRRVEFKLPYDMWWQHSHSQLPGRDLVPSWNYKKIRTNVYYDVKPQYGYEAQACNCAMADVQQSHGCGDDCINRMVYTECSAQLCPCRETCHNQKIQRHEWAPGLDKFMTKDKGWGVKTKQLIKNGDFILEYVGEVVSEKEFKDRMASRYMLDTHHYCLNLDGGLVIDGHRMGGDGRFVNHSCEPNCEMQKWSVHGLFRMALFALRDIQPDEELSYDYNFSLFNPAEGQLCKCGSVQCRGVIGGKSQRLNGMPPAADKERRVVGRPRKNARKNSGNIRQRAKKRGAAGGPDVAGVACKAAAVKPMSHQQRCFAQIHHCFLLRNLEKVKRMRERLKEADRQQQLAPASAVPSYARPFTKHSDVFLTQLTALSSPRNMRTRRLAQAEDNPELTKTARLAYVFRDLYNIVVNAKDERGEMLAAPFLALPTRRKLPAYFQRIAEPIDLTTLEQNIVTGFYRTVEAFDADVIKLFANNVRFFGRTSELGIVATRLRQVYNKSKPEFLPQLEEILGESPPSSFIPEHDPGDEEEDVIRCICGLHKDEGTMIQCERCLVWQHCDCVRADQGIERYLCERCDRRPVDLEIRLEETPSYATPGHEYYVTLLRGSLQLRQGDTVYVLRDMDEEGTPASQPPVKVTYKTVKEVKYTDLDIFRVERLWKDEKGDRFAFGHHFLRPHETYHEPSRKFFPNEVMRVPLYEVVPVELIMGQCWVLDINTFLKGRPVNTPEEHIYVCEYRVDKSAHLFTKIARPRYPICTKSYAFDTFDVKVKPTRTYTPHGRAAPRSRGTRGPACSAVPVVPEESVVHPPEEEEEERIPLARRTSQKLRLNTILVQLLSRLPSKQPLDVSYLLEPGRRHRKKTSLINT